MEQNKTRRRGDVNARKKPLEKHWTLTKLVDSEKGAFGFCVDDNDQLAYVPRNIVREHNITEDDLDAGFTARAAAMKNWEETRDEEPAPYIVNPLVWDADVVSDVDAAAPVGELVDRFQSLGSLAKDLVARATSLHNERAAEDEIARHMKWVEENFE